MANSVWHSELVDTLIYTNLRTILDTHVKDSPTDIIERKALTEAEVVHYYRNYTALRQVVVALDNIVVLLVARVASIVTAPRQFDRCSNAGSHYRSLLHHVNFTDAVALVVSSAGS